MVTFWSYLGWSLVGLTAIGYVWSFYRFVLFPKAMPSVRKNKTRAAA